MVNSYDWSARDRMGIGAATPVYQGQVRTEQLNWIENDLNNHMSSDLRVVCFHHPFGSFEGTGAEELEALINRYTARLVLNGHIHYDRVERHEETLYITTTTAASGTNNDGYWGYRQTQVGGGAVKEYN